jgi:hypothetical protein
MTTPSEEDINDMAVFLICAWENTPYSPRLWRTSAWNTALRVARMLFEHPGYLPSIVAARKEATEAGKGRIAALEKDVDVLRWNLQVTEHRKDQVSGVGAQSADEARSLRVKNAALEAEVERLTLAMSAVLRRAFWPLPSAPHQAAEPESWEFT